MADTSIQTNPLSSKDVQDAMSEIAPFFDLYLKTAAQTIQEETAGARAAGNVAAAESAAPLPAGRP